MDLGRDKTVSKIISRLETPPLLSCESKKGGVVRVEGTWGSFAPMLASYISQKIARPILYISPHIDDADKAVDDLHTFSGEKVELLPAWEGEEDIADATDEIRAERLRLVACISSVARPSLRLRSGQAWPCFHGLEARATKFIIAASVQALCQPIPKPEVIEASSLQLQTEGKLSPEDAAAWLVDNGFERVERVDLPGQFARRGGIVDIYAPLAIPSTALGAGGKSVLDEQGVDPVRNEVSEVSVPLSAGNSNGASPIKNKVTEASVPLSAGTSNGARAVRIEFFGDSIESIRTINLDTQRSTQQIHSIGIVSAVRGTAAGQTELFVNILPPETIIIFEEPAAIEEVANVYLSRAEDSSRLFNWSDIYKAAGNFVQLHICRFAAGEPGDFLKVDVKSVQQFQHKATSLWAGSKKALE
ncbi:MAG: hypothetical protein NTX52_13170, partial [Planctomycetota bacterium]|nr:hypothetical protein [Planctomycetota bacterium]